jgi:ABC-2 type transport system ATP-binding protein
MNNEIIEISNLSISFNLTKESIGSLKEYFINFVKRKIAYEEFWALKDVSFSVDRGDVVGIVGLNGSGKSTLLKAISGILTPTVGNVKVNGTIAPLIELGAGFDMELTARENIYFNGSILGHSRKFIQEHFYDIVNFAEIEKFIDVPLKKFSSGMIARLGFAIATLVKPDILIVDEVLSVGDFKFQEKSEKKMQELMSEGTTVLIVSHSIAQIESLCNKIIWLEQGKVIEYGQTNYVAKKYKNS